MTDYGKPVDALRAHVKDMQWQAEKKRREARELELVAATIFDQSIQLDLLADKIERAAVPPAPAKEGESADA